jgi:hypothetical protein
MPPHISLLPHMYLHQQSSKLGIKNRKIVTNNVFLYNYMVNIASWTENMDIFACDLTTDTPETN